MTRKHYQLVADAFRESTDMQKRWPNSPEAQADYKTTKILAMRLAVSFSKDNPSFDAVRFLEACGVEA